MVGAQCTAATTGRHQITKVDLLAMPHRGDTRSSVSGRDGFGLKGKRRGGRGAASGWRVGALVCWLLLVKLMAHYIYRSKTSHLVRAHTGVAQLCIICALRIHRIDPRCGCNAMD